MKFKMSEKSLFATLLRAPWWVSFLVMLAVALVAGALLPDAYKIAGMLGAFPFLVIGIMAAWRQRNAISPDRIQELADQARSMGWRDFSILVEEALRQQGFEVSRLSSGPADFQIEKNGRESQQAFSCTCMSLGIFSQSAIDLASQNPIQLLGPANIAQLMHDGATALNP